MFNKIRKEGKMPGPKDGKFWKASVLKDGGLGLFGNYLFEQYCCYGRISLMKAAGPMTGVASDVFVLYTHAKNGEWDKTKTQGLKLLKKMRPGSTCSI
jgi:hypothetical protein